VEGGFDIIAIIDAHGEILAIYRSHEERTGIGGIDLA
jgi:hypothetical protein